jgi:pyruvate/2-oxoglutarate dehydrogenase complex dihydrolipoamide dehydrogenase (E3) component
VVARKNEIVQQMRGGQEEKATSRPTLSWVQGHARFTAPHALEVNGEDLASERIFINTGTRPRIPPIPGLDGVPYLTNRNIMDVTEVPRHLVILGGNYIGLEFAQMFRRFGCRVTVIELNPQITPREDSDVAEALQDALEDEGISILTGARVTSVGGTTRGSIDLQVTNAEGGTGTLLCSHLLVATGQIPNSDDLGLDKAGVETDQNGWIKTNGRLETNVPGIWAIGDVKGGPAFTHISYDDHLVIYENLIEGKDRSIEGRIVPYALYTDPELGRVGLSEREAADEGREVKVAKMEMAKPARAREMGETRGFMKALVDPETDRIVGATVLAVHGGELMSVLQTAMMGDLPYTALRDAVYAHPTLAESVENLFGTLD